MIAIMLFYNSAPFLSMTLNNINEHFDKVVMVDGPYIEYPHNSPHSDDGSIEMAKRILGDKLTLVQGQVWNRKDKHNAALDHVPDNEWWFIIDSDEMIFGDCRKHFQKLESQTKFVRANIPCTNFKLCGDLTHINNELDFHHTNWEANFLYSGASRIFKKCKGMHYNNHRDTPMIYDVPVHRTYPAYLMGDCHLLNLKFNQPYKSYLCDIAYRHNGLAKKKDTPLITKIKNMI